MIDYKTLIQNAYLASTHAYSPYSKFNVGACLLTKSGKMYMGANIENSTYGATVCAERNAINKAVYDGEKDFSAIAIASSSKDYTLPCGICRQVMSEFSSDMEIIVARDENDFKVYKISELLPHSFSKEDIK